MRRLIAGLCVLLLFPVVAAAGPHVLRFGQGVDNGSFDFGPAGVEAFLRLSDVQIDQSTFRSLSPEFTAFTGPRERYDPGDPPIGPSISYYEYGPGVLTLSADWYLNGQPVGSGGFTVPITSRLFFEVTETKYFYSSPSPSEFTIGVDLYLGPGDMDPALAAYLGVGRRILGGRLDLFVYGIDGDSTSLNRHGQIYTSATSLEIAVAPEPGTTALVALGVVGAWRRSVRRSARSSR